MRASLKALRQRESPAKCCNTQLDLFNHSVLAHDATDSTSLCLKYAESARCTMEARQNRGLEIATTQPITSEGGVWIVPSQTSSKKYTVNLHIQTCTCLDYEKNGLKCKHLYAVENMLLLESGATLPAPEKIKKPTYKQEWHAYNLAQTNEKAKFQELLYQLCSGIEEPLQHMGRPRVPVADRIFAATFKTYSLLSGRRFSSDLMEAKRRGYVERMPTYSAIYRYLESEELTPYLRQLIIESSLPLKNIERDFAVDSSGFSTGIYQKWVDAKWGNPRADVKTKINKQEWVKVHVMCGCTTNIVTSVEITDGHAGDSPRFRPLVETTSENFVMNSVCADKAYSSNKNLQLVVSKAAQPFIAFKLNAKADKRNSSVWNRLYHYFMYNQDEFMRRYHRRSNVETTFSMIKAKFGERLRSKTETAQKNEVLCKILAHNLCCVIQSMYELGIEPNFQEGLS
jgi:transposase